MRLRPAHASGWRLFSRISMPRLPMLSALNAEVPGPLDVRAS